MTLEPKSIVEVLSFEQGVFHVHTSNKYNENGKYKYGDFDADVETSDSRLQLAIKREKKPQLSIEVYKYLDKFTVRVSGSDSVDVST